MKSSSAISNKWVCLPVVDFDFMLPSQLYATSSITIAIYMIYIL